MRTTWNTSILRGKTKETISEYCLILLNVSISEIYTTDNRICLRRLYSWLLLAIEERLQKQRKEHHPEEKIQSERSRKTMFAIST